MIKKYKQLQKYGAEAPFLRPKNLSGDKASAAKADLHALKWAEKNEGKKYDFIVELMATNPLKTYKDIDNVLKKIIKTKAESVIGVVKLEDHHPLRIKKLVNGKIRNFNKTLKEIPEGERQDLRPVAYIRNGSIYACRRDMLVKGKRYGTKNSIGYIMDDNNSVNIDTKRDLLLAKILLKNKKYKMKNFKVGILGAGFGERVVLPCVEFVENMKVKYIYCRNSKN